MLSIVVDKSDFSDASVSSQITSQNSQLRAPLPPLQTAWTGFNPCLYSGASSSAGPSLVENSNCKVFYIQQGHCD